MIVGECVLCGWCCSNIFSIKIKATGKILKGFDALSVTECAKCGIDERFETLPEITKCVYLGEDNKCKIIVPDQSVVETTQQKGFEIQQ